MKKTEIKLISASAGSGKTYRLMELVHEEVGAGLKAQGLVAVTYTKKAAEELKQRIREKLVESGNVDAARSMASARIGTVHSVCADILKRFSFEDGSSPRQKIIDEFESIRLFEDSLNEVLTDQALQELDEISSKFATNIGSLISDVRRLALTVRQNNLSEDCLKESVRLSLEKISLVTDKPKKSSNQENLLAVLEAFLGSYPQPPDTTKTTATAHKTVEEIYYQAKNSSKPLSWYSWVKLTKVSPGVKSRDAFSGVLEAARAFLSNEKLHSDLEKMIELAFKLSQEAASRFAFKKKSLGVLDYGDLEGKTLSLLDLKSVREELSSELDVLFVDEFQDTNPIQLAIFLKLSTLCKKTVWVGDLKQSIYRFRGADPDLMKAVLTELGKEKTEVLDSNWRSVPAVVSFVNSVFTQAFEEDGIPSDQVIQKPEWKQPISSDGLEVWEGNGKNKGDRVQRLANGVSGLLNQKFKVTDRETGEQRKVRGGDIAILCRSNDECNELSIALGDLGVSSSVVGGKLLDLPEISLALASYRYLVNSRDTIAAAEIALALGSDKDEWLKSAVNDVEAKLWNPALERISKARELISEMSIREKLNLAIAAVPVESVVEKMANGDSRIFHISALRQQAKKYEDVCQASFTPCTDVGFLEYLDKLEPDVPSTDHSDAIAIMTYHKSKGLEWPVVILASLEKAPYEPNLFEIRQGMVAGSKFKSTEPLASRVVTYLPWPFGGLKSIDELDAKTLGLKEIDEIRYAEHSETRRLLYVGMTRAREKLVLLETLGKGGIPNSMLSVLAKGGQPVLSFDTQNGKIISGKEIFDCVFKSLPTILTEETQVQKKTISMSLPQGTPLVDDVKPLYLQPSHLSEKEAQSLDTNVSLGRSFKWGNKLLLKRIKEMNDENSERADIVGSAVHLFFGSDSSNLEAEDRTFHAKNILERWKLTETLDADELVKASDRLNKAVIELWPNSKMYKEVPMEMSINGSIIRGAIDCLVVTDDEVVVIDHKTLTATSDDMVRIGNKYKFQIAAYANAVQSHFAGKKVSTWIHNPDGWMCEVLLK